jgi:hypothetical protein
MLMHLGFGFGLNEVYIMAAHWVFVIPIALAYLLKRLSPSMQPYLRISLFLLVSWLFLWNGYFISTYMTIS